MSVARLAPALVLLFTACAAWDSASPTYAAPPDETPTPSRPAPEYTPPPPVEPGDPVTTPPEAPRGAERAAIASVQLLENCPDPADESAPAAASTMTRGAAAPNSKAPFRQPCSQSTVQLAVHSDRVGAFRVTAVRVLDAASLKAAGTSTLRAPTRFGADTGTYTPWDERVAPGKDMTISYKLGELDLSRAAELVGPEFDSYMGPFILELDVTIGGRRQTIRSPEFRREPIHVMVT